MIRPLTILVLAAVLAGCPGMDGPDRVPGGDPHGDPPLEHVGGVELPVCDPVALLGEVYFLEGDTVTLSFECGSGADPAGFRASLVTSASGAWFDSDTWEVNWTTDLADGGRHEFLVSVWPEGYDDHDLLPETAVGTLWVADDWDHPQNERVVPTQYTEEWGLPVMHLEPQGALEQTHVPTTITFMGHAYDAEMKIRGAVSTYYPKNSYTLRFGDEDLDADRLGLGTKDHLVLITSFDDNSYARQKLSYDIWLAMADHFGRARMTPRTAFAVVYLYGEYWGLYTACDRIDDHFAEEMGLNREGNLFKAINHDANFYRTNSGGGTKGTLHDGYTKEEGQPEDGQPGAWDDLDALVAFSADSDDATFAAAAEQWIRTDEFMDWFLFVFHILAEDSAGKNAYLYNDPDDFGFRYVPWDMNHSLGQDWRTQREDPWTTNTYTWNNGIFTHFQEHGPSADELWARYDSLREPGAPLSLSWLHGTLDAYYEVIDRHAVRDWDAWGADYLSYWAAYNDTTYVEEREFLYAWLEDRDDWSWASYP